MLCSALEGCVCVCHCMAVHACAGVCMDVVHAQMQVLTMWKCQKVQMYTAVSGPCRLLVHGCAELLYMAVQFLAGLCRFAWLCRAVGCLDLYSTALTGLSQLCMAVQGCAYNHTSFHSPFVCLSIKTCLGACCPMQLRGRFWQM